MDMELDMKGWKGVLVAGEGICGGQWGRLCFCEWMQLHEGQGPEL